jgi:hypothetical protein
VQGDDEVDTPHGDGPKRFVPSHVKEAGMAPEMKISRKELQEWLGVGDAREELGRSRQGIRNMLESGELRGVKTRIGWLIDPASVRAFALLQQDEQEREKITHSDALMREAHQTHEVGA